MQQGLNILGPVDLVFGLEVLLLFDTSGLTCTLSHVEDTSTTNFTVLVHFNVFNKWGGDWEDSLNANTTRDFANRKSFGGTTSTTLNHNTLKRLRPFLVSLTDFVRHGNRVTRAKLWPFLLLNQFACDFFNLIHRLLKFVSLNKWDENRGAILRIIFERNDSRQ